VFRYRLSLDTSEPWKKILLNRLRGPVGVISDPTYDLHNAPLPLPPKKVKDLAKFRAWLPREFHALYPDAAADAGDESEDREDGKEEDVEDEEEGEGEEDEEDEDESQQVDGDGDTVMSNV
jgi:hypothetical protein